jgi:hypothetical protein
MELINAKENLRVTQLSKVNAALTSNNQVIAEQSHQLEKLNATKDKFFLLL